MIKMDIRKKILSGQIFKTGVLVAGILLCYLILHFVILQLKPDVKLLSGSNIMNILSSSVVTTYMVLCFCFIITMGIMDLSVGAICILACNVGGILAVNTGLGYFGLIGGAVIAAMALEVANIKMMLVSKIPPWIFGLGIAIIYEAIGSVYSSSQINIGKQVVSLGTVCRELSRPPWNLLVLALALILGYILFNRTSIGFGLRAIGSNTAVAKMMGINTGRTIVLAALCASVFLGLAAAADMSFGGRVVPITGLTSVARIFKPLAAYLLAKAFEKYINIIIGALVSAVIITSVFNILTLMGVPSGTLQEVVLGGIVLICGILSQRKFEGVVK